MNTEERINELEKKIEKTKEKLDNSSFFFCEKM